MESNWPSSGASRIDQTKTSTIITHVIALTKVFDYMMDMYSQSEAANTHDKEERGKTCYP